MRKLILFLALLSLTPACGRAQAPTSALDAGTDAPPPSAATAPAPPPPGPRHRRTDASAAEPSQPRAQDPRIAACVREATDKRSLEECLSGVHIEPSVRDAGHRYGAVRPSLPCPAQSVSWFFAPQTGSDDNTCTSSASPCKTYREITGRWGCGGSATTTPAPASPITVTMLGSHPDTTDRVIFDPVLNEGSLAYFTCQWTQLATGTFASVTPSSTSAADGRWKADLGSAATGLLGTRGLFVVDATRSNSVAAVHAVISGTQVALTQPFASNAPASPTFPVLPAENTAWAAGDTWQLMQEPTLFLSDFSPTVPETDSNAHTVFAFLEHCFAADPSSSAGGSSLTFGQGVFVTESWLDPSVTFQGSNSVRGASIANTVLGGGADLGSSFLIGGSVNGLEMQNNGFADGDVIISNGADVVGVGGVFGSVNVFNSDIDVFSKLSIAATHYAANRIYGTYTIDVSGSSETSGQPGASLAYTTSASSTFLGVPTWQIDHQTIACEQDTTHQQSPRTCGITISDANIDAAPAGVLYGYANSVVGPTRLSTIAAPSSNWLQAGSGISISQGAGLPAIISSTTSISAGIGLSATASTGAITVNLQTPVSEPMGGTGFTACPSGNLVVGGTSALGCMQPSAIAWPSCKGGSGGFSFTNDSTGPHVFASVSISTPNDATSHTITCTEAMQATVSMDTGFDWQVDHGIGVATQSNFTVFNDFQVGAGGGPSLDQDGTTLYAGTLAPNSTTTINGLIEVIQVPGGLQGATYSGQGQLNCCLSQ